MNMYSVAPNPERTGWLVKLEDVAPEHQYESEEEAIDAAEKMAKENSPSVVKIVNGEDNVIEERRF